MTTKWWRNIAHITGTAQKSKTIRLIEDKWIDGQELEDSLTSYFTTVGRKPLEMLQLNLASSIIHGHRITHTEMTTKEK